MLKFNSRGHGRRSAKIVKGTPPLPPLLLLPPLPLEVGPLNPATGVWWSAVSSPSRVWGKAPAEIELDAFEP